MTSYTLEDLSEVINAKGFLTKDRFVHYFTTRFSYSEREAKQAFLLFMKFPYKLHSTEFKETERIIDLAIQLVKDMHDGWEKSRQLQNIRYDEKELCKLIYKKGEENHELELNLYDANDIITYACLLRQEDFKQIALLRYCGELDAKGEKDKHINVFKGDIFSTNDSYYGDRSNLYIADELDTFQKLLYIKGKGYIKNGELNIEEERSYNKYAVNSTDWIKIGNASQDLDILLDN